ncbi:hypothetical protein ATCC90586_009617 [Pythium insidiosum]|nr:hypothetical protein ATCC90586_009617 [Pythium insidiosum]
MPTRSVVRPLSPQDQRRIRDDASQRTLVRVAAQPSASPSMRRDRPPGHRRPLLFSVCGYLRVLAMGAIAVQGLWPLLFQVFLVPKSVFGDGHGDRYEQLSYFAFENDHYQVLAPRDVSCDAFRSRLFRGRPAPPATTDLVRAVDQETFLSVRELAANATALLSVERDILGLPRDTSVCFGAVDDEGSVQIEALLSVDDAAGFGIDGACIQHTATHVRVRLAPTEFFVSDTVGELNPARSPGAVLIASLVDQQLRPVVSSSCYGLTREHRAQLTATATDYQRCVDLFSRQLLVSDRCDSFSLYDPARNAAGCAYSALGAAGAVPSLYDAGAYSFPAPWRMMQCTVGGECSSLLFTQLWLSEWTVERLRGGAAVVLRHNFVNHKVIEVTVDRTCGLRLLVSVQILVLVSAAWLTSAKNWHEIDLRFASPWARVLSATTACTLTKIVRSTYNLILAVQMVIGVVQWRNQLTIDMLIGADPRDAVLRAMGCGTLVLTLGVNLLFARTGSLKSQELEPSFAHVVALVATVGIYVRTQTQAFQSQARGLLVAGMYTVPATDVPRFSGCRGSAVCAAQVSMLQYVGLVAVLILLCATFGVALTAALHWRARRVAVTDQEQLERQRLGSMTRKELLNSFTRFLDNHFRSIALYDRSTQVYVAASGTGSTLLSTREHIEACGFVLADNMLFRYRDLPLFVGSRVLPPQFFRFFNMSVTIYRLTDSGSGVEGLRVLAVADCVVHAHWGKLRDARLDWNRAFIGGERAGRSDARSRRSMQRLGGAAFSEVSR